MIRGRNARLDENPRPAFVGRFRRGASDDARAGLRRRNRRRSMRPATPRSIVPVLSPAIEPSRRGCALLRRGASPTWPSRSSAQRASFGSRRKTKRISRQAFASRRHRPTASESIDEAISGFPTAKPSTRPNTRRTAASREAHDSRPRRRAGRRRLRSLRKHLHPEHQQHERPPGGHVYDASGNEKLRTLTYPSFAEALSESTATTRATSSSLTLQAGTWGTSSSSARKDARHAAHGREFALARRSRLRCRRQLDH